MKEKLIMLGILIGFVFVTVAIVAFCGWAILESGSGEMSNGYIGSVNSMCDTYVVIPPECR